MFFLFKTNLSVAFLIILKLIIISQAYKKSKKSFFI